MGGKRPHVEIAAVIPDGQGKIVIGKRKGKTGTGTVTIYTQALTIIQFVEVGLNTENGYSDSHFNNRAL